jgi:hypothetical protein
VQHAKDTDLIVMGLAANSDFGAKGSSGVTHRVAESSRGRGLPGALRAGSDAEVKEDSRGRGGVRPTQMSLRFCG